VDVSLKKIQKQQKKSKTAGAGAAGASGAAGAPGSAGSLAGEVWVRMRCDVVEGLVLRIFLYWYAAESTLVAQTIKLFS
jgi:hypothetical protein